MSVSVCVNVRERENVYVCVCECECVCLCVCVSVCECVCVECFRIQSFPIYPHSLFVCIIEFTEERPTVYLNTFHRLVL